MGITQDFLAWLPQCPLLMVLHFFFLFFLLPPLPFLVNFSYLSELKKLYSLCPFKKNSIENLNLGNWKITS